MKGANMNNFKTKINKKKLELTIVFLAFALVALLKIVSAASSPVLAEDAPGMPSLFYNDNHFVYSVPGSATYLPLQYANGVHYIPLDMLKLLNNIKMDSNDNTPTSSTYNTKTISYPSIFRPKRRRTKTRNIRIAKCINIWGSHMCPSQ